MRRSLILVAALAALAAWAVPAQAAGTRIDVLKKFESVLPGVKEESGIPVRIPTYLDAGIKPSRVYGRVAKLRENRYRLELGVSKQCNGANVCFVAAFIGRRNASVNKSGMPVQLARGITGYYQQGGCGAYCAPDTIQWEQRGMVYDVLTKYGMSKQVRLANQAIKAGAR